MKTKDKYYRALKENEGLLDEMDLGEMLGLDEIETREIIVRLLSENRIEYIQDRACSYRPIK